MEKEYKIYQQELKEQEEKQRQKEKEREQLELKNGNRILRNNKWR